MKPGQRTRRLNVADDIFGVWVPIVALTASTERPVDVGYRDRQLTRLDRAVADLTLAADPRVASWRDVADMQNLLQSLIELGWATDEGGHIEALKNALQQGFEAYQGAGGKLRLTGPSIAAVRECLTQYGELLEQLSARDYWKAVKHTKDRVWRLLHGHARAADKVIKL